MNVLTIPITGLPVRFHPAVELPSTRTAPPLQDALTDGREHDPAGVCRRVALVAYEALQGHRSLQQLSAWVTTDVLSTIETRLTVTGMDPGAVRQVSEHRVNVARVRCSSVSSLAVEVSLTVEIGERTHAVAARVEARQSRWRVTDLVLG